MINHLIKDAGKERSSNLFINALFDQLFMLLFILESAFTDEMRDWILKTTGLQVDVAGIGDQVSCCW